MRDPNRREFLSQAAALIGVPPLTQASTLFLPPREGKAKAVIQIFLDGGLTHIDTFDPKPDAPVDVRGNLGTIKTSIDGVRFGSLMRSTAKIADKIVVVRSMTHGEAAHERGRHNMLTGYRPNPAVVYPAIGSVVAHELGVRESLPPYVCVPNGNGQFLGTGYLSSAFGPFSIGSEPNSRSYSVKDLVPPRTVDATRLARRRNLLEQLDGGFDGEVDSVAATQAFYSQAWELIDSAKARAAFDMGKESKATRDAYGRSTIGQRLLLARRLVEGGVRYVTVMDGGYDMHEGLDSSLRARIPALDRGYGALIADLDKRGILDSTLVLLTSEFGRTPRINNTGGRDHWPKAFSVVAAGGGLKRGLVHGSTDLAGAEPADSPVGPADLAATVYHLMGVDFNKQLMGPGGRPITIVYQGRVLREILA